MNDINTATTLPAPDFDDETARAEFDGYELGRERFDSSFPAWVIENGEVVS